MEMVRWRQFRQEDQKKWVKAMVSSGAVTVSSQTKEVYVNGTCPVCQHVTRSATPIGPVPVAGFEERFGGRRGRAPGPQAASPVTLLCQCGYRHPGSPRGAPTGCGAYGPFPSD